MFKIYLSINGQKFVSGKPVITASSNPSCPDGGFVDIAVIEHHFTVSDEQIAKLNDELRANNLQAQLDKITLEIGADNE